MTALVCRNALIAFLVGLVLCGRYDAAAAQTTYGLIEGRITDATGGALPGALVTVSQPNTGFVSDARSK